MSDANELAKRLEDEVCNVVSPGQGWSDDEWEHAKLLRAAAAALRRAQEMEEALRDLVDRLDNKIFIADEPDGLRCGLYPCILSIGVAACINESKARAALKETTP